MRSCPVFRRSARDQLNVVRTPRSARRRCVARLPPDRWGSVRLSLVDHLGPRRVRDDALRAHERRARLVIDTTSRVATQLDTSKRALGRLVPVDSGPEAPDREAGSGVARDVETIVVADAGLFLRPLHRTPRRAALLRRGQGDAHGGAPRARTAWRSKKLHSTRIRSRTCRSPRPRHVR